MFLAIQEGRSGNISAIRKLVRVNGFDLDCEIAVPLEEQYGRRKVPRAHTAFTWASWQGNLNLVKVLLEEGATPHHLTCEGLAGIHCCTMKRSADNLSVLKHFVEQCELPVDFCNEKDHTTPLMYASLYGHYEAAQYLLEVKAEVNREDWEGKTALFYAVRGGDLELVKMLVAHNASVNFRDNKNGTVLHYLLRTFYRSIVNPQPNCLIDLLVYLVEEKGVDVRATMIDGTSPIHIACQNGLAEAALYLLRHGAELEAKIDGWETPLWSVVKSRATRTKLITKLVGQGANLDAKNCLGMTMSQYARLVSRNERVVSALENAQKVLKTQRMKELQAKRKELLSFRDNIFCKSTSRISPPLVEEKVEMAFHFWGDDSSATENGESSKTLMQGKAQEEQHHYEADHHEPEHHRSEHHEPEQHEPEPKKSSSSETYSSESSEEEEDTDEKAKRGFTSESYRESMEGGSDEIKNEKAYNFRTVPKKRRLLYNKAQSDGDDQVFDEQPSAVANNNNLDVKECFERLLRKKRLFEDTTFYGDPEKVSIPQKIQSMRRRSVIMSDSD